MKRIILMLFVSMIVLSPVHASEEIQLAAAIGGSSSSSSSGPISGSRPSGSLRYASSQSSISDRAIIGTIVVGLLAVVIEGGNDSASNH